MNYLIILIFCSYSSCLFAQAYDKNSLQYQMQNPLITKTVLLKKEASLQTQLWENTLKKDSSNKEAWLSTYLWTERDQLLEEKEKERRLNILIKTAFQHIGEDGVYYLMQYLHSGSTDAVALSNAFEKTSNKAIIYPYRILYKLRNNDRKTLRADCIAFDKITPLPTDLQQYHINTLNAAGKNAVVYAKGLHDLVPMCVLQYAYGIRPDVKLKYYEEGQVLAENDYLCLSLGKAVIAQYPKNSYTGLLVKNTLTDAFEELKRNMETLLELKKLPYQKQDTLHTKNTFTVLQKNYLPGLLLMLQYYEKTKNAKQVEIKNIIDKIKKYTPESKE